jgi:S-adenosylmethionine:tRNA ribosyltransferase-isomerase
MTATTAFDYILPNNAVAQEASMPRDAARLLDASSPRGEVIHRQIADLPGLVGPGDLLVVNDTRVRPARLRLRKDTGGAVEVLLLDEQPGGTWEALVRPGRRVPPGTVLRAGANLELVIGARLAPGTRVVEVRAPAGVEAALTEHGEVPLPPYLDCRPRDPARYQTVFARRPGSAAAPTAGLHLTTELLDACRATGAEVASVELRIGLDTFRPIEAETVEAHEMHSEGYAVPLATWEACRRATRVIAIGTTVVRALESAAATGRLEGRTDLFIHGDYKFAVVDTLLTNFHMPRSSLLVLLASFAGDRWRDLYETGLREGYRFLSLGDAMLVSRAAT